MHYVSSACDSVGTFTKSCCDKLPNFLTTAGNAISSGFSWTAEKVSTGWNDYLVPGAAKVADFVKPIFAKIGEAFTSASDWVRANPQAAKYGAAGIVIGAVVALAVKWLFTPKAPPVINSFRPE